MKSIISSVFVLLAMAKTEFKKPVYSMWTQKDRVHETVKDALVIGDASFPLAFAVINTDYSKLSLYD